MTKIKLGIIGLGNMGMAIVDGLLSNNIITHSQIYASAHDWENLVKKCDIRKINPSTTENLIKNSNFIVVALKPYLIEKVLSPYKDLLKSKVVISVAAGFNFDMYEKILDKSTQHISTIPNTPISISKGILIVENKHSLVENNLKIFENLFSPIANIEYVDTSQLRIASVISGCGPAFVDIFIEALGDAGVRFGLSRKLSYRLASKMIEGASSLQFQTQKHPGELKDEVCSPNGTTIVGVSTLEEEGFRKSILKAVYQIMKN